MDGQGKLEKDQGRQERRFERSEPTAGELVAKRLQDEMRSAVESVRSRPWVPAPDER